MGSCGVSTKANDGAWVVEESYFNSSLSLADKGECGSQQPSQGQPLTGGGQPVPSPPSSRLLDSHFLGVGGL